MTISIFEIREKSGRVYLIGRDENDKKVIIEKENKFAPYHGEFYVKKGKENILKEFEDIIEVRLISSDKKSIFGDEVILVRYRIVNFDRIKELRGLINKNREVIFEGDLYGKTLFCLDVLPNLGYTYEGNWRKGFIDIETDSQRGFPDANNPTDKVLCMTCYDSYEEKYHYFYWGDENIVVGDDVVAHKYKEEKEMLWEVLNYFIVEKFDVITGWNINFDVSYLLKRFLYVGWSEHVINLLSPINYVHYNEQYKQYTIGGVIIFDLLEGYKRIVRNQMASFKLDSVGEEELGEGKIEVNYKTLGQIPRQKLFEYNRKDVELCVRIDKKVNIFNFFDGLRQFVGCSMDDVKYSRTIIDFMLLKKARSMGIVLPTSNTGVVQKRQFQGAFVDAVQGSYSNVIAFDIAGLYPNIIKTFNLSPECIKPEGEIKLPEISISMEKEGIIPGIVNDLMVLRKRYDEERDKYPAGHPLHEKNDILVESSKLIVDAIYGITAFPGFRLFKSEIASSITYLGREIIIHTKEVLEKKGYKVVVTDTDSSYFVSKKVNNEEVIVEGIEVLEIINKEYPRWVKEKWGIEVSFLKNVFKKVYRRLIVGTKKRYCGHVVWAKGITSNKIEVVGLECKRSDYSRFARDLQYGLIKMLLFDKKKDDVLLYLKDKMTEMKTISPELIGIPTKIEKELKEYVTNLPKVRGASYSNKITDVEFHSGDKPLLLFTSGESDIVLFFNNIEAKKLLERVKIDWNKMIERNILLPTEMLLESDEKKDITQSLKLFSINQRTLFNWR